MSASAQRNGMELIAVVMKAPTTAQRFQDASSLLGLRLCQLRPDHPPARKPPGPGGRAPGPEQDRPAPAPAGVSPAGGKDPGRSGHHPRRSGPRTSRPRWTPARPWGSSRSMLEMSCGLRPHRRRPGGGPALRPRPVLPTSAPSALRRLRRRKNADNFSPSGPPSSQTGIHLSVSPPGLPLFYLTAPLYSCIIYINNSSRV